MGLARDHRSHSGRVQGRARQWGWIGRGVPGQPKPLGAV